MFINDDTLKIIINNKSTRNIKKLNQSPNKENSEREKKSEKPKIRTLLLDSAKVYSIELKNKFTNIECLSMRDSLIKNIDFILNLPYIYYLDLYQNPIENYNPIVKVSTFGYLSFCPPLAYLEKQILSIKNLHVIILHTKISDKSNFNNFILKNPNIFIINNDLIDFEHKIRIFNTLISLKVYIQKVLNGNDENLRMSCKVTNITTISERDSYIEKRFQVKTKKSTDVSKIKKNEKCIEIEKYFEEYNKVMFIIFHKKNKQIEEENMLYNEERKKLLFINKTFYIISSLLTRNDFCYEYGNSKISKNIIKDIDYNNFCPNINIEIFRYLTLPQYKIFALSIILLYILQILSKDISLFFIMYIFTKNAHFIQKKGVYEIIEGQIKSFFEIKKIYLFTFYYKIYDSLFGDLNIIPNNPSCKSIRRINSLIKNKNILIDNRFNEIQDKLTMLNITNKINDILKHQDTFVKKFKSNTDLTLKNKIIYKGLIKYFEHLQVFDKIICILQYVDDFIIYNNLSKKLGFDYPEDMQFFTEIKNYMFSSSNIMNKGEESMAEKNYNKIQLNSLLNNKFFFLNGNYSKTNKFYYNVFLNYRHKTYHPDKKKIEQVDNIIPANELRKQKIQLIKEKYINNALNSFFQVYKESVKNERKGNLLQNQSSKSLSKFISSSSKSNNFSSSYKNFPDQKFNKTLKSLSRKALTEKYYNEINTDQKKVDININYKNKKSSNDQIFRRNNVNLANFLIKNSKNKLYIKSLDFINSEPIRISSISPKTISVDYKNIKIDNLKSSVLKNKKTISSFSVGGNSDNSSRIKFNNNSNFENISSNMNRNRFYSNSGKTAINFGLKAIK